MLKQTLWVQIDSDRDIVHLKYLHCFKAVRANPIVETMRLSMCTRTGGTFKKKKVCIGIMPSPLR